MKTKSNLSCLLHFKNKPELPPPLLPSSSFLLSSYTSLALFSFMLPYHLTLSSLLQLFCLLRVMSDNDLSCVLPCVCTYVHFTSCILPHPPSLQIISTAAFFLLPLFVSSFFFLWKSSISRSCKDCLDILCNCADHCGAEVPCVKSTSSKTMADVTSRFSVVFLS